MSDVFKLCFSVQKKIFNLCVRVFNSQRTLSSRITDIKYDYYSFLVYWIIFSRLKDGDFTEIIEENDIPERYNSDKPYAKNSFINFECDDDTAESYTDNKENKQRQNNMQDDIFPEERIINKNDWATGRVY